MLSRADSMFRYRLASATKRLNRTQLVSSHPHLPKHSMTSPYPPSAGPLSDDVLYEVLNTLGLGELITTAAVCRQWRAVAFSHPTFTQNVSITGITPASVERFHAQLNASRTAPLSVTIKISALQDCFQEPSAFDTAISYLAPHLHRVVAATLHTRSRNAEILFATLRAGAPLLQHLDIGIWDNTITPIPGRRIIDTIHGFELPQDLLGGCAPQLRTFEGLNVRMPKAPIVALRAVQSVRLYLPWVYNSGYCLHFAPHLTNACFPAMQTLRIDAHKVQTLESPEVSQIPPNLAELYVHTGRGGGDIFKYLSPSGLASIPRITITHATARDIASVLTYMPSDLRLGLTTSNGQETAGQTALDFVDLGSDLRRRFIADDTSALLVDHSIWRSRVVELTLAHSFWAEAMLTESPILSFPAATQLTILLDVDWRFPSPTFELDLPALKKVILVSPIATYQVDLNAIQSLLTSGLTASHGHLELQVAEGLVVVGAREYARIVLACEETVF